MISMDELRQRIINLRDAAEGNSNIAKSPLRLIFIGNLSAFNMVLKMMDGLPEEEKPPRKIAPSVPPPAKLFCMWCDDPWNPSIEHHPHGQTEHLLIRKK